MEDKIEIKSVEIQLGKEKVKITIEQAKKLKDLLDDMFGKEIVREKHHYHNSYPWRWHWDCSNVSPLYVGDNSGTITYGASTQSLCLKVE